MRIVSCVPMAVTTAIVLASSPVCLAQSQAAVGVTAGVSTAFGVDTDSSRSSPATDVGAVVFFDAFVAPPFRSAAKFAGPPAEHSAVGSTAFRRSPISSSKRVKRIYLCR